MFDLRTLGAAEVRPVRDPRPVEVSLQPRRLALLAYLAVAQPRGMHRRESILVVFWPEDDEHRARGALSQAVHAIRQELGRQALVSKGHELIGVDPASVACDAVEFERFLDAGELENALRLYRGEFLNGLPASDSAGFDRWREAEGWRLKRRAWRAAASLAGRAEEEGNLVAAVHWLEQALVHLPTDESLLRRLMLLLDGLGDRAGAIAAYQRFAEGMREDYDIDPAPETDALLEQIRNRGRANPPRPDTLGTRSPIRSIAVLPLENLTGQRNQNYFADGMTEALTIELSGIRSLRVVSRRSVRAFKNSDRPLRDVSELLGVEGVLEGSVLRAGNRVRVTLQLVRVLPEEHLWTGGYDRDIGDVLAIYTEVARAVATEIEATLTGEERRHLEDLTPRTVGPEAYDHLLRGLALVGQAAYQGAVEEFQLALALDPGFAEAHAWLAQVFGTMSLSAGPALAEPMREHVDAALALDPALELAHQVDGYWLQLFSSDWDAADRAYRRALSARRRDRRALGSYVLFLAGQCRFDEAFSAADELLRFDPGVAAPHFLLGWVQHKARRFEESVERLDFTMQRWPEYPWTPLFLAGSAVLADHDGLAVDLMRAATRAAPDFPMLLGYAGAVFGRAGARHDARGTHRRLVEMQGTNAWVDPFYLCLSLLGLGKEEEAMGFLERMVSEVSVQRWILAPEPFVDPLRDTARFQAVLRALHLPDVAIASGP